MKKYLLVSALLILVACHDDSSSSSPADDVVIEPVENASYEITAVNMTVGQPLSPIALFIHDGSSSLFTIGEPASTELEVLAEGGDNTQLLEAWDSVAEIGASDSLGPGASASFTLELNSDDPSGMFLTIVTMLVNTNDAITAVNGVAISELGIGDSMTFETSSYDTGTEANSEEAGTIPGPAGGGEGFNALRDDVRDQVTMHGGVVTAADGLSSSDLSEEHRWDNPVARFIITRMQ